MNRIKERVADLDGRKEWDMGKRYGGERGNRKW